MSIAEAKEIIRALDPAEKLNLMEEMWADVHENYMKQDVPPEHAQIVRERYERYKRGESKADTWENVKKRILNGG